MFFYQWCLEMNFIDIAFGLMFGLVWDVNYLCNCSISWANCLQVIHSCVTSCNNLDHVTLAFWGLLLSVFLLCIFIMHHLFNKWKIQITCFIIFLIEIGTKCWLAKGCSRPIGFNWFTFAWPCKFLAFVAES